MFDLPVDLPPPDPAPPALIRQCSHISADHYGISPLLVQAVIEAEGGTHGTVSANSDGSYDLGVMQINTINLPEIQKSFPVTWQHLAYRPCLNIAIGTWFLANRIRNAPDTWTGVGNYHSYTPEHHHNYLNNVMSIYARLVAGK